MKKAKKEGKKLFGSSLKHDKRLCPSFFGSFSRCKLLKVEIIAASMEYGLHSVG